MLVLGLEKLIEHNYQLLKNLALFKNLDVPHFSRCFAENQCFINHLVYLQKKHLNATTSANTIALLNGANILTST